MPSDTRALVIEIMLHDDRWHGDGDWPPSPFRLFQALVAAAARGARLEEADRQALEWLEALEPPTIAAPRQARVGQLMQAYVPNNDLDAVGGNPDLVEKIRAPKRTQPYLLQSSPHFLYVWRFAAEDSVHAPFQRLTRIVHQLYQFGRGIDMAWARAHVLTPEEAEAMLHGYPGSVHDPCDSGDRRLPVPTPGSLRSLEQRFAQFRSRLETVREGRTVQVHFRQPSKPVRRMVSYACPPHRLLFDIRQVGQPERFAPLMQRHIALLTAHLRDMAAARLRESGVDKARIERYLVGRGADAQDKKHRARIIPLPSIGHEFAGGGIRRVLVEVPQDCPLDEADVRWAFEGLCWHENVDAETGELTGGYMLVETTDTRMQRNYGAGRQSGAIHWRTITPAALPARRYGKAGSGRLHTEEHAIKAVRTALRHAGVRARPVRIRVQREPFDRNSHRADDYEPDRFDARQLWHVEIVFDTPVSGPLVIGNGRYLGLGLMAPCLSSDAYVLPLEGEGIPKQYGRAFVEAARRAMIAAASRLFGEPVEPFFHGHEENSDPLRPGHHAHVFLCPVCTGGRVVELHLIAPWLADRAAEQAIPDSVKQGLAQRLEQVAVALSGIRIYGPDFPAAKLGICMPTEKEGGLFGSSRIWVSMTPYWSTRHPRKTRDPDLESFLREDVLRECERRELPRPEIMITHVERRGTRLRGRLRLEFSSVQRGPFLLGWQSHRGGGVFLPMAATTQVPPSYKEGFRLTNEFLDQAKNEGRS